MTQTEFNFIQSACVEKLNTILQQIVDNNTIVNAAKEAKQQKTEIKEVETPKTKKKGEN